MKNLKAVCEGIGYVVDNNISLFRITRADSTMFTTPYTEADFPGPGPEPITVERVVACCLMELGYYGDSLRLNIDREHIGKTTVRAYVLGLRAVLGDLGQYLEAMEADLPLDSLEADFRALDIGHDPMSVEFELELMPISWDELYERLFEKDVP